ncbi:hypothetical protein MA16_Dca022810 [Dendrobium catenatum]|uniref:Uncharacterized protein n=1 Tax=Dendrobium catenatum TaxID=906689 RepID=A0A2I0W7T9_9ASPA|nr:hypothetical protein MA16_Dca022810 [Dendrobium catenatum]
MAVDCHQQGHDVETDFEEKRKLTSSLSRSPLLMVNLKINTSGDFLSNLNSIQRIQNPLIKRQGPLVIKEVFYLSLKRIQHVEGKEDGEFRPEQNLKLSQDNSMALEKASISNSRDGKGCLRTQVNPKGLLANSSISYHDSVVYGSNDSVKIADNKLIVEVDPDNMFSILQSVNEDGYEDGYLQNTKMRDEDGKHKIEAKSVNCTDEGVSVMEIGNGLLGEGGSRRKVGGYSPNKL